MSFRRRPLHTCGVSIIEMAHRAYDLARDLTEPLGSDSTIKKRISKVASFIKPIVQALLCFWLLVLSFIDDQIILFEDIIERIFPSSRHIFYKIDGLVLVIENLPEKFDTLIHRFPLLDRASVRIISELKLLISTLIDSCGSRDTKEKDIVVDINCDHDDREKESESLEANNEAENQTTLLEDFVPTTTVLNLAENYSTKLEGDLLSDPTSESEKNSLKSSYKEVIEKGKHDTRGEIAGLKASRNESERVVERELDEIIGEIYNLGEILLDNRKKKRGENIGPKDDPIIEMFESGWLMKRGRREQGRSVSSPLL